MLKGKQVSNNTIKQEKLNIKIDSIIYNSAITNKQYVDEYFNTQIEEINYAQLNQNMTALNTSASTLACEKYIIEYPISDIIVKVNGLQVNVGGKTNPYDCYFSNDSGVTISNPPQKGDYLYWNNLNYNLDNDDVVDFEYLVNQKYIYAKSGETYIYNEQFNNLVIRFTGDNNTTSTIIISNISYIIGNSGGSFIFDIGGSNEHIFTYIGETININNFTVVWDGFGSLVFSVKVSSLENHIQQLLNNSKLLLKDLIIPVNGYWKDYSTNNFQIIAATTFTENDSLIMPVNNITLINILISAGCYEQFYIDNFTPKKVLISNLSPCYNNFIYYNYIEKCDFIMFDLPQIINRRVLLQHIKTEICEMECNQTSRALNSSISLTCATGKLAYVDFGNWENRTMIKLEDDDTSYAITSTNYQPNKLYKIQLFSKLNDNGFRSINKQINDYITKIDLNTLPKSLTSLEIIWHTAINNVIGDLSQLPRELKYLKLNPQINTVTNDVITGDFVNLPPNIEHLILYNLNNITGTIYNIPRSVYNLELSNLPLISGTLKQLPENLTLLYFNLINTITGTLEQLPRSLTFLTMIGAGSLVTGTISELPTGLTTLVLGANNNISGTLTEVPSMVTTLKILNMTSITGTVSQISRNLQTLQFTASAIVGTLIDLPNSLLNLNIYNNTGITGTLSQLPTSLTNLVLNGTTNKITGNVSTLPSGLTLLNLYNITTGSITGNFSGLPRGLKYLYLRSCGTINGTISDLPTTLVDYLYLYSSGQISGSLAQLPRGLTDLYMYNVCSGVTGSWSDLPANLNGLSVLSSNAITGTFAQLPRTLTTMNLSGCGTNKTGSLADLPNNMIDINLISIGAITGDLADLSPILRRLQLSSIGSGITGDLADLPKAISTSPFNIIGMILTYNGGILPKLSNFDITIKCGLTTSMIDTFLINWSKITEDSGSVNTINLSGTNKPHSVNNPDVIAAKALLTSKNKVLILN